MATKLVFVLIDDNEDRSRHVTLLLSDFVDIYTVLALDEVPAKIAKIIQNGGVVDVIITDLNMEADTSSRGFTMHTAGQIIHAVPQFDMAFGARGDDAEPDVTALDRSHDFKPFGPILALPFAQFFRGGGVIVPVSGFWQDERLILRNDRDASITKAQMNGFVYVALRLIWEWGDAHLSEAERIENFAKRLATAYETAVDRSNPSLISDQAMSAVKERRTQLFRRATAIQGLSGFTIDQIFDDATVTVWTAGEPVRHLERASLFADYALRMEEAESALG